jgi:hypothetical protein
MLDRKQRIFRLIETQINESHKDAIQEVYGLGTKIKINSISEGIKSKSLLLEGVIILGGNITEDVLDTKLAEILIQDILFYFYPRHTIQTYIRFDV